MEKLPVLHIEILRRSDDTKGFKVQPRRWVVERTFESSVVMWDSVGA